MSAPTIALDPIRLRAAVNGVEADMRPRVRRAAAQLLEEARLDLCAADAARTLARAAQQAGDDDGVREYAALALAALERVGRRLRALEISAGGRPYRKQSTNSSRHPR